MKKIIVLAVFSFLLAVACKGPQGEVGPQGTQGEKGATGAAGTNGTNGTNGATGAPGNSDILVKYSKWTSYTGWVGVSTAKRVENITVPNVGGNIFTMFLVFAKPNTDIGNLSTQYSLPDYGGIYEKLTYSIRWEPPVHKLTLTAFHNTTILNSDLEKTQFRWVSIQFQNEPSGRKSNIDYSDYEAVKKAYNIPD